MVPVVFNRNIFSENVAENICLKVPQSNQPTTTTSAKQKILEISDTAVKDFPLWT